MRPEQNEVSQGHFNSTTDKAFLNARVTKVPVLRRNPVTQMTSWYKPMPQPAVKPAPVPLFSQTSNLLSKGKLVSNDTALLSAMTCCSPSAPLTGFKNWELTKWAREAQCSSHSWMKLHIFSRFIFLLHNSIFTKELTAKFLSWGMLSFEWDLKV